MDDMDEYLFRVGSNCAIYARGKHYISNIRPKQGVYPSGLKFEFDAEGNGVETENKWPKCEKYSKSSKGNSMTDPLSAISQ